MLHKHYEVVVMLKSNQANPFWAIFATLCCSAVQWAFFLDKGLALGKKKCLF